MTDFERFAKLLNLEAAELSEYADNLARVNGGDETEQSSELRDKSRLYRDIAKLALAVAATSPA